MNIINRLKSRLLLIVATIICLSSCRPPSQTSKMGDWLPESESARAANYHFRFIAPYNTQESVSVKKISKDDLRALYMANDPQCYFSSEAKDSDLGAVLMCGETNYPSKFSAAPLQFTPDCVIVLIRLSDTQLRHELDCKELTNISNSARVTEALKDTYGYIFDSEDRGYVSLKNFWFEATIEGNLLRRAEQVYDE